MELPHQFGWGIPTCGVMTWMTGFKMATHWKVNQGAGWRAASGAALVYSGYVPPRQDDGRPSQRL